MKPDTMGEEKLVTMLGGIRVELAALKAIRSLLLGSGWTDTVAQAGLTTIGRAESVTLAHHAHEICTSSHCILVTYTPKQGLQDVFKIC